MTGDDRTPGPDAGERPFPAETDWLSLSLPAEAERTGLPSPDFVDRVAEAIAADAALDRALAQQALGFPRELLAAHAPPPPSPGFVDRTMAALRDDRRARWQRILSRHVAPAPTPFFVARTLAALRRDREAAASRRAPQRDWRTPLLAVAVAAAAALWLLLAPDRAPERLPSTPLQVAVSPAFAPSYATATLASLLVRQQANADRTALPNVGPDGLWLLRQEGR